MDRQKLFKALAIVLGIVLLLTSTYTIYLLIKQRNELGTVIDSAVQSHINKLDVRDGYSPIKGIDYVDGKDATSEQISESVKQWFDANPVENGSDGADGKNGQNGKDAPIITNEQIDSSVKKYMKENPPQLGLTPIIRCNEEKNRWEVKYNPEDTWQLLGGTRIVCTVEMAQ